MQRLVERDILVQLTLMTLVCRVAPKTVCTKCIRYCSLLDNLGFTVHDKKSVLIPTKEITFVGFIFNSADMTVRLPLEKKESILKLCLSINKRSHITIREFSRFIGKVVATEP